MNFSLPCFVSTSNAVSLRPKSRFPERTQKDTRSPSRISAAASNALRRKLIVNRLPHVGLGSIPKFVPSTRHADLNLFKLTWTAVGKPVAGVLISPGLQWHSGWFGGVGSALAKAGVTTVALDGIGMGRSDALRGMRGFILDMADHVDELKAELRRMRDELPPGIPLFVLGESSGGLSAVVLALAEDMKDVVRGYILCGPAIKIRPELLPPPFVLASMKLLVGILPWLPLPGEEVGGETWDQAFGNSYYAELSKKDPHVGYGDPVRIASATAFLSNMDRVEKALARGELQMPDVLVLHNRKDERTDFNHSKKLVERVICPGGKATLVEPGGVGHQLFQDTPEVTHDVIDKIVHFVLETAQDS